MSRLSQQLDLSPASTPGDEFDAELSATSDVEPEPGLNGVPVKWFDANRAEAYTKTVPFHRQHDPTIEFFYRPLTLTALGIGLATLAYVAATQDLLEEGRDKRRVGAYAVILSFLVFSMVQFRDGPFIRPHPAFWRVILGINVLYELSMVFLVFQDLDTARHMMTYIDSDLGKPLPEKNYAENCEFTFLNVWNAIDIFCVAHTVGWFFKALILRNYWFCWILSVSFELAEYSLQHQLANFAECWWDHWIMDVLVCNWIGTYIGMKTCQYFEVKHFEWRGLRQTRGIRAKGKRIIKQLAPHDFTAFKWEGAKDFTHYLATVLLIALFLLAELNPFYLKSLLWMEPDHPLVIARLAGICLCALPAVRELYEYISSPRKTVRMGTHVWLLLATVLTELLVIIKFSRGQFAEPTPVNVKRAWGFGFTLLVLYPIVKFAIPSLRQLGRETSPVRARKLL